MRGEFNKLFFFQNKQKYIQITRSYPLAKRRCEKWVRVSLC